MQIHVTKSQSVTRGCSKVPHGYVGLGGRCDALPQRQLSAAIGAHALRRTRGSHMVTGAPAAAPGTRQELALRARRVATMVLCTKPLYEGVVEFFRVASEMPPDCERRYDIPRIVDKQLVSTCC